MASISRSKKFQPLVESLTLSIDKNKAVFPTIKDLLIFAAMVGYEHGQKEDVESEKEEVPLRIFETNHDEMYFYLTAIVESKNPNLFKDKNQAEMLKIFERYAAGGLQTIQGWFDEKPANNAHTVLLDKLHEKLKTYESGDQKTKFREADF
jgi:dnd system-associated protein 4